MSNKFFVSALLFGVSALGMGAGAAHAADLTPPAAVSSSLVQVADAAAVSPLEKGALSFVDSVSRRGIGFLSDPALSQDERRQSFRALLRDSFDLATIGRFALGRYWRVATPAQRAEYQRLFEQMIVDVYSERFSTYNGQKLKTAEAKTVSDTDAVVTSYVMPKDGGEQVRVDWRVRAAGGRYRVVDVIVEGVSMSVTQRSDFSAVIQRGGGDVAVLIDHLKNPGKKG